MAAAAASRQGSIALQGAAASIGLPVTRETGDGIVVYTPTSTPRQQIYHIYTQPDVPYNIVIPFPDLHTWMRHILLAFLWAVWVLYLTGAAYVSG